MQSTRAHPQMTCGWKQTVLLLFRECCRDPPLECGKDCGSVSIEPGAVKNPEAASRRKSSQLESELLQSETPDVVPIEEIRSAPRIVLRPRASQRRSSDWPWQ